MSDKNKYNRDNLNQIIEDVLESMQPRIEKTLYSIQYGDREDLEQEIKAKIIEVSKNMREIDFWSLKETLDETSEKN
ncbi:hypothetical protein [Evansella clarkii]|uniref:hypothetical protein n=1 Tax=Evansella clarkii TaxID=79879 RepID=UPI0009987DA0|nr:hypothetical protein [Evansella clarkii]